MAEDGPHTHKPTIRTTYSSHDNPKPFVKYGDTTAYIRTWGPFRKNAVVRALAEAKYRHDEGTHKYLKKQARRRRLSEREDQFMAEQRQRFEQAVEKQGLVEPVKELVSDGNGITFQITNSPTHRPVAPDFLSNATLTFSTLTQDRARQQAELRERQQKIVDTYVGENRFIAGPVSELDPTMPQDVKTDG